VADHSVLNFECTTNICVQAVPPQIVKKRTLYAKLLDLSNIENPWHKKRLLRLITCQQISGSFRETSSGFREMSNEFTEEELWQRFKTCQWAENYRTSSKEWNLSCWSAYSR
jgi:hypothetical protein